MKTFPRELRWRITQALCVVVILAVVPRMVAELDPLISVYFPPFFLTLLMMFTIFDALILWCPLWLFARIFPGHPLPDALPLAGKSLRNHRIAVLVSGSVSGVLAYRWMQSL